MAPNPSAGGSEMTPFALQLRLVAAASLFTLACRSTADEPKKADPPEDKSVVPGTVKGRGKVENGSAFDKATLDLGERKKLAVPEGAEVIRKGDGAKVEVFMKKTLNFGGFPPQPMSIREGRKIMGCATKIEDGVSVLATFGEFSTKEGGTRIKLVLVVPEKIEVEKRATLSGPKSSAHPERGEKAQEPAEKADTYWYGHRAPAVGWNVLKSEPDPEHRADKAK
jgi:hypothetical protein